MSDKLAISTAFSVFAMTAYVLFGGDASRAEFGPASFDAPALSAPSFDVKALAPKALFAR